MNDNIMNETKKTREDWIEALESGEYEQTKNTLCKNGAYCCLGVAAKEIGGISDADLKGYSYLTELGFPFKLEINLSMNEQELLGALNDAYDFNFEEIAKVIKSNYDKEVLFNILSDKEMLEEFKKDNMMDKVVKTF